MKPVKHQPSPTARVRARDTGRSPRIRAAVVGCAGLAAAGLLLTGCAAGQIAQTAYETPVVDGIGASVGDLTISAASVAPPATFWDKGSDAPLQLTITNAGDSSDQLTSVSTPVAPSVSLESSAAPFLTSIPTGSASVTNPLTGSANASASASVSPPQNTPSVAGLSSAVPPSTGAASQSPTVSGSTSGLPTPGVSSGSVSASSGASGSGSASGSSAAAGPINLGIAPHSSISLGFDPQNQVLVLRGLSKPLYPGTPFTITFTFAHAGAVTMTINVRLQTNGPSASIVPSLSAPSGPAT